MQPYTEQFYQHQKEGSKRSAREIVPLVLRLIQPRHVIDVGCGIGTWLSVFRELGCEDILGVDGEYVDKRLLQIPAEKFLTYDLTKPLRLNRQFDLVVSLEVAEHLPAACAETFVDSLTRLGPVLLFSAAIPFQGGTHHINEQWPDYWVRYFQARDFVVLDPIRKQVWDNQHVEYFYAQNILMFVRRDVLESHPILQKAAETTALAQLSMVHPQRYLATIEWTQRLLQTIQDIARLIPPQDAFILVDQEELGGVVAAGRRAIPFLECDGQYWGPPPDDHTAIRELERLRQAGARFVVFAWPAFWWLDYYAEFHQYLRAHYGCVLENDQLLIFNVA
jgi:SAM-dependent methyltransferase